MTFRCLANKTPSRGRVHWTIVVGALLVCGLIGGATVWLRGQPPLQDIPAPDLTTANVQVAQATDQLRKNVVANSRSAEAWGKYGEVLMAHEWNAEALVCFQNAAVLEKTNMRWPYLSGILLERQQPDEALKMFEEAKQLQGDYAPLYYRMSKTLLRLDAIEEAEAAMKMAAKLASDQPQPWIGLARIAQTRNDWQAAHDLLAQAVKIAPDNREAIVELTRTKLMLGTATGLQRDEQKALLSGEKYQPMADPIFNSISEKELAARFAAALADQYAARGNLEQAEKAFLELIDRRPNLARPRINLASLYLQKKQFDQALKTLEEVTRLFPEDAMGHYMLSFALDAVQRYADSRQALETAVRLKPDYAEAQYALGLNLQREGQFEAAEAAYRRAVQADVRMPQAHLALGVVLQKQSKWDEAIAEMKVAVRLTPGDPVPESYLRKALAQRDAQNKP